ncbi:MAG: secretin, partial [Methylobacterium sp.]
MTPSPRLAARRTPLLACLLAGLLPGAMVGPSYGQPSGGLTAAPILAVGTNETATSRRVDLTMGRSLVIDLPRDAKEVFVANPKVANAVVRSTRKVFIIGMENGATSIFIMDAEGRQITALDVTVARDLNVLRQTLNQSITGGRFDVR